MIERIRRTMNPTGAAIQRATRLNEVLTAITVVVFLVALLASPELTPNAFAQAQAAQISATICGSFDPTFEGKGAWVGYALVTLDNKPFKVATFADRNTSLEVRKNGSIHGTETISFKFADGSGAFDILAEFEGVPGATPNLYFLHETGTIANGTGDYSRASGSVTVQGPFLFPDPTVTTGAPTWMAEVHGAVVGLSN